MIYKYNEDGTTTPVAGYQTAYDWMGTHAAYDIAVAQGKIKEGMVIFFTDDTDSTPVVDMTADLTDKAVAVSKAVYVKVGRLVTVQVDCSASMTITTSTTLLCTLPADMPHPLIDARVPVTLTGSTDQCAMVIVKTTGAVQLVSLGTSSMSGTPHIQFSYITED